MKYSLGLACKVSEELCGNYYSEKIRYSRNVEKSFKTMIMWKIILNVMLFIPYLLTETKSYNFMTGTQMRLMLTILRQVSSWNMFQIAMVCHSEKMFWNMFLKNRTLQFYSVLVLLLILSTWFNSLRECSIVAYRDRRIFFKVS